MIQKQDLRIYLKVFGSNWRAARYRSIPYHASESCFAPSSPWPFRLTRKLDFTPTMQNERNMDYLLLSLESLLIWIISKGRIFATRLLQQSMIFPDFTLCSHLRDMERYSPACTRLLSQYKTILKLVGDEVSSVEQFMSRYRVRPS